MKFFTKNKSEQPERTKKMPKFLKKSKWKKLIKVIVVLLVLAIIAKIVFSKYIVPKFTASAVETKVETSTVETRDIQVVLSSSGTVEPLNTYELTTLVEGEVIAADFEEGDQVEAGDVLYQITTDDLDSKIETAETAVTRAEKNHTKAVDNYNDAEDNYSEAVADYNEAADEYGDFNIETTASGTIKTLYVEVGDTVQVGAQIAEVYDNSSMLLEIPFNASEVDSSFVGKSAEVEITDSSETIKGKVTKVSSIEQVLTGNRVVKTVTIKVTNPGGLTTSNTATASIGDIYSSSEGTFSVLEETVITADKSGEIAILNIEEGSKITNGDKVITLSSDSYDDQLESYTKAIESAKDAVDNAKDSVESAEEAIEDAKSSLEDIKDSKTDYSITAPISGQIIRKNVLAGDTVASNSNTALCIIYDLSALTFEMSVDELDVMTVEVGQEVNITADALDGIEFSGIITNVSLESTQSSGVTQYPVTVKISDVGDLLPGMNVTGEIVIDEVTGVLAIPSDALQRGDVVYVKDDTVLEAVGDVPAGFKEVEVETGLTDGDYIEIISGLTGTEEVYITRTTDSGLTTMMPGMGNGNFQGGGEMPSGERPSGGNSGGGMMP